MLELLMKVGQVVGSLLTPLGFFITTAWVVRQWLGRQRADTHEESDRTWRDLRQENADLRQLLTEERERTKRLVLAVDDKERLRRQAETDRDHFRRVCEANHINPWSWVEGDQERGTD
jgi:hypothetical protein